MSSEAIGFGDVVGAVVTDLEHEAIDRGHVGRLLRWKTSAGVDVDVLALARRSTPANRQLLLLRHGDVVRLTGAGMVAQVFPGMAPQMVLHVHGVEILRSTKASS